MKLHVIIDFMHIYYKYFFQMKENKIKKLSAAVEWNGTVVEKDTTLIYYPLRDIEGIRKNLEGIGHDVTLSICFDMPSHRKDDGVVGGEEYKSGRKNNLTEEDLGNINFIEKLLTKAGHNTYRLDGYEADDIVNYLVRKHKDNFDYTIIYTNDKDLIINVCDNVGVMRFKQYTGYTQVDRKNYESYLEPEFKAYIPYNALGLYLASVGDKADRIKGINKFGPKAFSKLITKLASKNEIDWNKCGDYNYLAKIISMCKELLSEEQFKQLIESFTLVANLEILDDLKEPNAKSTRELRELAYNDYAMISLIP